MATKPPIPSSDVVKQLAQKALSTGVTRVVATLVDPAGTAKRLAEDVKDLPKKASGLPLKVTLEVLAASEKVRALLPGSTAATTAEKIGAKARTVAATSEPVDGAAAWDAAAPVITKPAATAAPATTPAAAPAATSAPAKKAPAKKAAATSTPAKKTATKAPAKTAATQAKTAPAEAAPVEATPAEAPLATVTPIHEGRDGHTEIEIPPAVEAAIEAAPDGATLPTKELPIAGYDNLSLAQLRARLAKLDIVAVTQLRDHERSHADRTPIVTMLENRIVKLTAAATD